MENKISIIVPVYNVAEYLPKCLDSLVNQTLRDIEIILATDGPQDCHDICDAYAKLDNRIVVIKNLGGYGKSVNEGIKIAKGEYIGIVESDDWIASNMYETLFQKAQESDADIVKGSFYNVFEKKIKPNRIKNVPQNPFSVLDYPSVIKFQPSIWSAIYKKDFLIKNNIFFMEERLSFIDTPFHIETFVKAKKYVFIRDCLYFYNCCNPNQSVKSKKKVYDGIITENYIYEKIKNLGVFHKIKNVFYAASISHLLWNYNRIDEIYRDDFWKKAQEYISQWKDDCSDVSNFSKEEKEFFEYLSTDNSFQNYERNKRTVKKYKLFSKLTLVKVISEKGVKSVYLSKLLIYRRKIKL